MTRQPTFQNELQQGLGAWLPPGLIVAALSVASAVQAQSPTPAPAPNGGAASRPAAVASPGRPAASGPVAAASGVKIEPGPSPSHPWLAAPPRVTAEAYFSNLEDGARIETPYRVTFGLSGGWGLAPIAKPVAGKSGHHHLLINRDLPLNFKEALPFNEQYMHFGKGQMEAVLNLAPGKYKLRLLLADEKHLPHFVFSKPVTLTVTAKKGDVDPKTLVTRTVEVLNIKPDARLRPPFRVQFHASGFNVAHLVQKDKDTGHFRVTWTPATGRPVEIAFLNGQTEAWFAPPPGAYALKLELVDNLDPTKILASAAPLAVRVE